MREAKSFCRICHAGCGTVLTIDDHDRIVGIRGDGDNEMSHGYACFKGLQARDAHHGEARLLHALKRQLDGSHAPISSEQALDEIAEKMQLIRDRDGSKAIGLYAGGGAFLSSAALPIYTNFLSAIGSDQWFTPSTIDQPNKAVSAGRMGAWAPGIHSLDRSEVLLLLGTNPLVSHLASAVLVADSTRRLKAAKARGLKLICIDPRRTETARHSDLHLQPIPGQDPAILAGLIRLILSEGWEDRKFCAQHIGASRLSDLRKAVEPCTPEAMERRAGLEPGQLRAVAEMFARDHKMGPAIMTTGGSFASYANLARHLLDLLNILCGRFNRAGDHIEINMFAPVGPIYAEVTPPTRHWEAAPPSRIRGVGSIMNQKLTPTLADEILEPGEGQIKCLIMAGGNPAAIVPDESRIVKAIRSLELSVTIDPWMTASARLSDYVLAPTLTYERADLPLTYGGKLFQHKAYGHFTPAIVSPPKGSDVIDDWYFFWAIASRLGCQIIYEGKTPLDMSVPPTTEELLAIRCEGSRVNLEELKHYPSGKDLDHENSVVASPRLGKQTLFDVMPEDVAGELKEFLGTESHLGSPVSNGRHFRFLLSSRRSLHLLNSTYTQLPEVIKRNPSNPAFINPLDMREQGIEPGDLIEIESDHARISAVAQPDEDMRRGVISLMHGWTSADAKQGGVKSNVNALIDVTTNIGTINAMPRMSAIPVNIHRLPEAPPA